MEETLVVFSRRFLAFSDDYSTLMSKRNLRIFIVLCAFMNDIQEKVKFNFETLDHIKHAMDDKLTDQELDVMVDENIEVLKQYISTFEKVCSVCTDTGDPVTRIMDAFALEETEDNIILAEMTSQFVEGLKAAIEDEQI